MIVVLFQLLGLVEGAEAGDVDLEAWRKAVEELTPEEQNDAHRQHLAFMQTVICMQEKHHLRWLTQLLPCAIYHPNPRVGVGLARALLALYDDKPRPENVEVVHLYGLEVKMDLLL